MKLFIDEINEVVKNAFEELGYERETGKVNVSNRPDLCQYQCNGALANAKKHKKAPMIIANEVVEKLNDNKMFSKLEAVAPGFINMNINDEFLIGYINDMNKDENLGKLTSRTILMLLGTTAIAASIGLIVGNLFKLGIGTKVVTSTTEIREISSVVDTLRGLLPSNIVASMANANIVAVVIFAAFIGNAIKRLNKKYSELIRPFVDLIEASYKIIVSVSITIIKMMPYAVIALMANTIAQNGIESIFEVLNFIIALYVSVIIMFVVHLIIVTFNGVNPITYLKNVSN